MSARLQVTALVLIGVAGGLLGGLFGVGGGLIMVPLLVAGASYTQHQAHATSLAAIIPIALVGAARFGVDGEIAYATAAWLAVGALIGAPVGARIMARSGERGLRAAFGVFMVATGVVLILR